ncbi:MAG: Hpt domain-containing protein [Candidatus Margulisiibacteriota bacterium]|jgi:HPt (histidine-containing phosphotransfer) domain-containing protein
MDKILVKINKDIMGFMPDYLQNRQTDFMNIKFALDNNDFERVKQIAHKMRGSAGLYGLMGLTDIAKEMEENALTEDKPLLVTLLQKMIFYLENIEIIQS